MNPKVTTEQALERLTPFLLIHSIFVNPFVSFDLSPQKSPKKLLVNLQHQAAPPAHHRRPLPSLPRPAYDPIAKSSPPKDCKFLDFNMFFRDSHVLTIVYHRIKFP